MRRFRAATLVVASSVLTCGCLADTGANRVSTPARDEMLEYTAADHALRALVNADKAAARGDTAVLRDALAVLEQLAVRPSSEAERETLDKWQELAPREEPPLRGSALGPAFRKGALAPGRHIAIAQTFLAGQRAELAVETTGSGSLSIEVLDSNDKAVCMRNGSRAQCSWLPLFTERHSIRLTNRSSRSLTYYLVIE